MLMVKMSVTHGGCSQHYYAGGVALSECVSMREVLGLGRL